jgi:predicted RNA methylase
MRPEETSAPLCLERPELIQQARAVLNRAGFDETHIPERLGVKEMSRQSFEPIDRARIRWRTQDADALSTLIRLFLAGIPVDFAAFRAAVQPMEPADWTGLGLVEVEGDLVHRSVALRPCQGFIVAHDFAAPDGRRRPDYVLGLTGSTLTLASATFQPECALALDLGTGSGFLALLAARRSQRVLATDVNPRAVNMAAFNALLNGMQNIDVALGDLFAPTRDLRFDLILCNPPFVISPESDLMFRDSGLKGDEVCARIVREAPAHLAEGGYAQIMCNWVRRADEDWRERVSGWIDGSGCDAWIIQIHTDERDIYADHWLRQGEPADAEQYAGRFQRWMSYYRSEGIDAIDSGLIVLRRRTGACNWVSFDTSRRLNHPNGVAILGGFASRDLLQSLGDDRAWLDLRLICHDELRFVQRLKPAAQGWIVDDAKCTLGEGLQFEGQVSPLLFHLLTLCRGHAPLSAVLREVAVRLGQPEETVAADGLEAARALVAQGFLQPAPPRSAAQ